MIIHNIFLIFSIFNLTPSEARKIGIKHRSTLKQLKDRIKEEEFNMDTKEIRNILKAIY